MIGSMFHAHGLERFLAAVPGYDRVAFVCCMKASTAVSKLVYVRVPVDSIASPKVATG